MNIPYAESHLLSGVSLLDSIESIPFGNKFFVLLLVIAYTSSINTGLTLYASQMNNRSHAK